MAQTIRDGKGRGYSVGVNSKNRMLVRTTSVQQCLKSTFEGKYYEAATGKITLTTANETGIIYVKNGMDDNLLVIDRVFWDIWGSTGGGTAGGTIRYYRNPTIAGGTDIVPYSTLFSELNLADGTFKKDLSSITGDVWWTGYIAPQTSVELVEGRMTLPAGYSWGLSVAAPAGNTSMAVSVNCAFYFISLSEVE